MDDFKVVVGKAVLLREKGTGRIIEVLVVKTSPSGRYAKICDGTSSWWIDTAEYAILEEVG